MGVPGSDPAHARLDLVENQQAAFPTRDFAQSLEIPVRGNVDAALALDGFEQHRAGFVSDEFLDLLQVAVAGMGKTGNERMNALVVLGLSGG